MIRLATRERNKVEVGKHRVNSLGRFNDVIVEGILIPTTTTLALHGNLPLHGLKLLLTQLVHTVYNQEQRT